MTLWFAVNMTNTICRVKKNNYNCSFTGTKAINISKWNSMQFTWKSIQFWKFPFMLMQICAIYAKYSQELSLCSPTIVCMFSVIFYRILPLDVIHLVCYVIMILIYSFIPGLWWTFVHKTRLHFHTRNSISGNYHTERKSGEREGAEEEWGRFPHFRHTANNNKSFHCR